MSGYIGSKRSSSLVSATEITLDGAKLKSSGDSITKSDGTTAVLSESAGVVTLNNGTIGSGVTFPFFVGMIASFASSSFTNEFGVVTGAPSGWLVCNGAEYAIADYGDLHTAIGTTWGALTNGSGGAGSTHFRVPDLRGAFLRGTGSQPLIADGGAKEKADGSAFAGVSVGSFENDSFQGHQHEFEAYAYTNHNNNQYKEMMYGNGASPLYEVTGGGVRNPKSDATNGTPRTDDETRPFNAGINYCIKY